MGQYWLNDGQPAISRRCSQLAGFLSSLCSRFLEEVVHRLGILEGWCAVGWGWVGLGVGWVRQVPCTCFLLMPSAWRERLILYSSLGTKDKFRNSIDWPRTEMTPRRSLRASSSRISGWRSWIILTALWSAVENPWMRRNRCTRATVTGSKLQVSVFQLRVIFLCSQPKYPCRFTENTCSRD